VKHIYSAGVIYDHHLGSSKYFYNTGCSLYISTVKFVNKKVNITLTTGWQIHHLQLLVQHWQQQLAFNKVNQGGATTLSITAQIITALSI
jgi:hypothetical protein